MSLVQEAVRTEKEALDRAFEKLDDAIKKYARNIEDRAKSQLKVTAGSEIDNLRDEVRNLQNKLNEAKEEISHISMELVRLKDENKRMRLASARIEELLSTSIKDIEEMVA